MNIQALSSTPAAPTSRPTAATPQAGGDAFVRSSTAEALPTRQALAAAVRSAEAQATPMVARGAVNGLPMDWLVQPDGSDTWIRGHQNGLPLEARVHAGPNGSTEIEGFQNGRGLYVKIDRTADGTLRVEGRRTGRGLSYLMTEGRGTLTVQGAQDGMVAGFTVVRAGQALALEGGVGGLPAGIRAVETPGGVRMTGGVHGLPTQLDFQGGGFEQLGDFLPGLSTSERAAVLFILLSAAPR